MKLSIILCVYNEIRVIDKSFHELYENCEKKQLEYEIIIIDNASNDGTKEWLESLSNEKVIKILNNKNIGKGGSIKKGINKAAGEYLIIFDPDQEYEIQSIWDCLNHLKKRTLCVF